MSVASFVLPKARHLTFWQLGIKSEFRGKGLATQLITDLVQETRLLGCNRVELSLEPDNHQSFKAFEFFAKTNEITIEKLDELSYFKPNAITQSIAQFYQYLL